MKNKAFYRRALTIAVPMMIQNGITQFVGLLDNMMVGRIGTDAMSGVAIVNQLIMVWNLMIFGGLSGIGIFTAQFYGKNDRKGLRYTFRLMMQLSVLLLLTGLGIFFFFSTPLISLYLYQDGGIGDPAMTLQFANRYLSVMLLGFLPFIITQVYTTILKSTGETVVPMRASLTAVVVNLIGNYVLIYGKLGFPKLGVAGAAAATVAARFVEMGFLVIWTQYRKERFTWLQGAFRSLYVPVSLLKNVGAKTIPLMLNETLWAGGQAALTQCYAYMGLSVVAAFNISSTVSNVFCVAFIAMGAAIGIILGQELGQGNTETIQQMARRLTWFSVFLCTITAVLMLLMSGIIPQVYNTSPDIRALATTMLRITALTMPIDAYANAAYFTLRSGGKTFITFLFDSCFSWVCTVPAAFFLTRYSGLPFPAIYAIVLALPLIKCLIGSAMVRRGIWINDITEYS
ncbi:MAG: MATE family efflux transporter [Lachnospiraceae bacterium]|nr:MATE family efflux transporter [Lachnospiraceae bacterium]